MAEDLHRSWKRTRTQLDRARRAPTNPNDQALKEYESYLDANELGLAVDELVALASSSALRERCGTLSPQRGMR